MSFSTNAGFRAAASRTALASIVLPLLAFAALSSVQSEGTLETTPDDDEGQLTWAQDCDISIHNEVGSERTLTATYTPNDDAEWVTVVLRSRVDVDIGHKVLGGIKTLKRNTDLTIKLSNLEPNQVAKLTLSGGLVVGETEVLTHGAVKETSDTSTAWVFTTPSPDGGTFLWISMNERAVPFWIRGTDFDFVVKPSDASTKHTLSVVYAPNVDDEKMVVKVTSSTKLKLHHPVMAKSAVMNADQEYTITLSDVKPDATPKLKITPDILTTAQPIELLGEQRSTSTGFVQAIPHDKKTMDLWISINGRGCAVQFRH